MTNASLTIVGTGIKCLSHLTTEAKACIEQSDRVLYLLNDPVMKDWVMQANKNATALDALYYHYKKRIDSYQAISNYILDELHQNCHVCVVLYGHPTVFSLPALRAAVTAKQQGYHTRILPGISAEDCLYADLLINPGSIGCLSYEATDLLIYERKLDPTCHLIIWQICLIGELEHTDQPHPKCGLTLLQHDLLKYYPPEHTLTFYVAAQYPSFDPTILHFPLRELANKVPPRLATLYIPPTHSAMPNQEKLAALGMTVV